MPCTEFDRSAIRTVIESQLQAFQQDDAEGAFAFASPGIQALFQTPTNFMAMVRQSYQPVYRPRSVVFEELTVLQELPTQPVLLLSPEGDPVRALYVMEKRTTGQWRITGCYLLPVDQHPSHYEQDGIGGSDFL